MSRSYRKPWIKDGYGSKGKKKDKQFANKAVRNAVDVPDGKAYRRYYNPWDICDYRWYEDGKPWWNSYTQEWEERSKPWKARTK